MDNNLQSFFNQRYGKQKPVDTRTFGEKVDEFFNPVLTPYINARPDKNRPQYVPEDIPPMEEDYSNTINLIKDIAKRADISQQTKSDLINRLAQRAQKQQTQILSMSAQPYENFSTYMTKRAGLAAQDLIMAPQRIGTAAGEAIGSFGESVITGKPYEEILAKNKKNRNELLYLSVPQIEQILTKYGKGENLIKPSKNIQELLANTNDMLRRERESQYEMGANLGEAKDVIIQSLMGSDYGKIEVPKELETVAGISGFIFDAVVDPTNLLPGVGIGVSGTKAISRKALRTAISNADTMEDLVLSVQKAVANGVDKKEVKKIFYTRLEQIGKKVTPAENIEVKPTKPTAEAPPTIISKKPASVSVPEEQVGTITPTIPEKPPEAQISGQAGQGIEALLNKDGLIEANAGFNPFKPFIENYETVAKPFVKTTETVDAVIRTMDNIAGGKVSQFVNKAFHGDTYREVRKELQVAGQMASQDIASVSDYIASTMTYKLNNDLTDWFANTRRAWSGLNADLAKQFKTIMETLGDFAEIKQGTGVSTKEYALLDTAGRREEKMIEKAGAVKGRRRVIPENEAALNNIGIDPVTFSTLKKLGFIDKYALKSGGKGVALTQVGKQVADEIIKYSGKTPEELAKFMKKVDRFVAKVNKGQVITLTPEVVESIKKLPNLVDVSPMNIGMDVRKIAKYALDEKGILRKAQEYSDDEIKRLVDDGYLHEYFNERGEQVYRLTDKGKAVRAEINQASFKDLAIYKDKTAYANLLKKAGISADEDLEEISQLFVNWFQERTVALAEKIPMSEKQLQKLKYQWGKYFPKQRATLSETGLRKIMDNPEIYTKEQVELATDIHSSIKNPKILGVKVVKYRKNLSDAIQRNVDLSEDGVKVPRQWQAEAGLPYNPDLKISADARDLVETQYLRSWAFNRSSKEFSELLQPGRVGVKNVDLVNTTLRVMSKKYDAILPYITNPTDVLQGVMSKVSNTLRMNDAFENLAKHTEYVRTDLDPKLHGTSYTDVVDGVGVTYKYINPEQTEYLSLAGKYVNENVLKSIQTRIDGSAQSLCKFSLDGTWSKFLRPIWYAGMTSSNLSYHAINMVTSGVNMLLHAPQLGLRPFSVAKTSLKWFKTLGSPKLRREFADEIQDMIEHQIIGQENIAVNPKSYGTITRGNIGAFEINKTINKVGVTIQEILDMAPAFANMSDQLARITYYQEKINDLKKIMQKADYKALSPEQQADFVAQFKAKAADQAQTIIPSYIDTANALRAVNEVMPLMSWGMKAYKIPYRNLMTLLGKNDIKGFGNLSKSINMTEKAKAAFALIGLPALAGYYAYNKVQTNREQAMAEAATTPEYRNNFYDQKWCKMIPSIEDLFERQEDYLAAKYVIDAVFNRSFSFETNEGVVKISGSNYGERYRLPEFSSPLVTYGNIIFSGTKVNPFTGTGEPITDKEGWERAKDLLAYTIFVSSASSQRYNSEVRRLKKKGLDEKQARIQAYAKLVDAETLLRYDVITQEDLIKRTKGEHYRLKKQIAGLKKMTPEEQQKAIPGIERQGERVRVRADLIDYLPKGKEE